MDSTKDAGVALQENEEMLKETESDKHEPVSVVTSRTETVTMTKNGVIRNLLLISMSFTLHFSAFNSFASLQSSLNKEDGLGTTGLACVYAVNLLSNLLVTPVTLSRFSSKWIMIVSILTYIIYIATGFYPSWYTIIPASVIVGMGGAHIWLAMQAYITDIARRYANITGTKHQDRLNLFLGIFYACHYTSNVWGNLVSSFVFQRVEPNVTDVTKELICGPNYCPYLEFNASVIIEPSRAQIYTYTGVCAGLMVLALILMLLFVNNISTVSTDTDVLTLVQDVIRQMCTSGTQILLFFPTILGGLSNGFLAGDFTLAYISCPFGIKNVGFVMVTFGVCLSLFSFVFGKLTQYTGHMAIYFLGFIAQLCVHITMLLWIPDVTKQYIVYIMAALFGVAGAVNVPLISGLYNLYFTKNRAVALSCFRVLHAAGWTISMGYSSWLCTQYKLYILICTLVLSFLTLTVLHIQHKRKFIAD